MKTLRLLIILLTSFYLTACGKNFLMSSAVNTNSEINGSSSLPSTDSTNNDNNSTEIPNNFKPTICSDLSFTNVTWPSSLSEFKINAFALAMNITGSFEGSVGWKNLSNNFDGQGVSLGLFNQNLGQGSLQPLLLSMRTNYNSVMKSFYTESQYNSLNTMLTSWGGSGASTILTKAKPFGSYESDTSELDDPRLIDSANINEISSEAFNKASLTSLNQASVDWAVNTVYSGTSFKPEWKTAFQNMAGSPEFITHQVAAANAINNKALAYMKKFGFKELRAYLFFFDIVVQNGGLTTNIENQYLAWVKSNGSASETTKLKKMLEFRLTLVISIYVNDVRSRKLAVIDGFGLVHGSRRNFPVEYCGPSWSSQFSQ